MPIFCLSPLAIHARNLIEDPRCSLVVQMPGWTGLANARVTIFGDTYQLPADMQVGGGRARKLWRLAAAVGAVAALLAAVAAAGWRGIAWRQLPAAAISRVAVRRWFIGLTPASVCVCAVMLQDTAREIFLAKQANTSRTEKWVMGNYMFFRMHRITDIYFVGGFGTVQWVDVNEYLTSTPDAIATNTPSRTLQVRTAAAAAQG